MKKKFNSTFLKVIHFVIAIIIVVVVMAMPYSYYYKESHTKSTTLDSYLYNSKYRIELMIKNNPELWQYELHRVRGIFTNFQEATKQSTWQIINNKGEVLFHLLPHEQTFSWARISRSIPIYDSHLKVATIRVQVSFLSEILITIVIAIFSLSFGLFAYLGLRDIPLRALNDLWKQMLYLTSHDPLTGVANRTLFNEKLINELICLTNTDKEVALLSIDLDHFKDVNDTLGHAAGDTILKNVVNDILALIDKKQTLARLGGDEFSLIYTGYNIIDEVGELANEIIKKLSSPYSIDKNIVHIGASIGITITAENNDLDGNQLLKRADLALYQAKNNGRNTYHYFEEWMHLEIQERKSIESDLRVAIKEDILQLYYQPQFDFKSLKMVGVEALLRWDHSSRGFISPDKFIPIAEKTGLIEPIGEWVLNESCRQAMKWPDLIMAINISPLQFRSGKLIENVITALERSGLPADRLELEITEGVLLHNTEKTLETLSTLKELGVKVAMDDFGTGYSSLSYMRRFPFDKVKIDRSFVAELAEENTESIAMIQAIISMVQAMGMTVIAEGVETTWQADLLQTEGCEEVQGYLFGRPMNERDLSEIIHSFDNSVGLNLPQSIVS